MPKTKKKESAKRILWVKVKSKLDLVRAACSFDTYSKDILLLKIDGKDSLCFFGEELDDTTIGYYYETKCEDDFIIYSADAEGEKIMPSKAGGERLNAHYINVVPIEELPLEKAGNAKDLVLKVKIGRSESLIKSIIKKGVEKEDIESAYIFEADKKMYIGVFDLLEELSDSKKIFYYAELSNYEESSFIRYNYSVNKIEFTKEFGEHTYLYIKLINLAEPFPFF